MELVNTKKGFTLIEILIVMLIIGIVSGVAIFSMSHNRKTEVKNAANQLVYLFRLAEDQALLQPTVLGATIKNNQINFYEFTHDAEKNKDIWVPTTNELFAKINFATGVHIKLQEEDDDVPATDDDSIQPQIIFASNGEVNPFTLLLGQSSQTPLYKISAGADGTLRETQA